MKKTIDITPENRDQYGGNWAAKRTAFDKRGQYHAFSRRTVQAMGITEIGPGDIVYVPDPTLEFEFTWLPMSGTDSDRAARLMATLQKNFRPVEAEQFSVRPELDGIWQVINGGIYLEDRKGEKPAYQMYYRTKAESDASMRELNASMGVDDILGALRDRSQSATAPSRGQIEALAPEHSAEEFATGIKKGSR